MPWSAHLDFSARSVAAVNGSLGSSLCSEMTYLETASFRPALQRPEGSYLLGTRHHDRCPGAHCVRQSGPSPNAEYHLRIF